MKITAEISDQLAQRAEQLWPSATWANLLNSALQAFVDDALRSQTPKTGDIVSPVSLSQLAGEAIDISALATSLLSDAEIRSDLTKRISSALGSTTKPRRRP